jgi:arginine N-succinyltransferase
MILLREIQEKDLEALERFSQIPGFINLQNDRDVLRDKIRRSRESFRGVPGEEGERKFIFVAEDLEQGRVVGTSMIASQHGTANSPHFYFQVGNEKKFSESIGTGFIHGTLELKHETDGPSEIGGLVLDPEFRNSGARLGRQISFVRFLFLGLNRKLFKNQLLAELLPPLNKKGQSPLWEAIGRRFTNMDYWEADQLCQKDKEFIFSLFPTGKIYTTFLTAEARNAIGKVGKDTEPVVHMLKKIGFKYMNQVDPFDGGPHLWANPDELAPIQKTEKRVYAGAAVGQGDLGLVCRESQPEGEFRAMCLPVLRSGSGLSFCLTEPEAKMVESQLKIRPGDRVVFMPFY